MTHLDLFSGIGGFALAARWAGFDTIGFSEIDQYASRVLKKHWPEVPNFGDVRNVPTLRCDLITGGFPCQPFSVAGRRKGTADNRNCWPAMLDVIGRCKPDWVLGENVVNIKNMVLSDCLDDLEKRGYQSKAFDIPNCAVGLPSLERHIWIVASNRSIELEGRFEKCFSIIAELQSRQRRAVDPKTQGFGTVPNLPRPNLHRSRKGIPDFVDRIKCLGNAVPPQVAYQILKVITEISL
jgi:DNA (cytosine-5)-methyltransferase 1